MSNTCYEINNSVLSTLSVHKSLELRCNVHCTYSIARKPLASYLSFGFESSLVSRRLCSGSSFRFRVLLGCLGLFSRLLRLPLLLVALLGWSCPTFAAAATHALSYAAAASRGS